jgi:hypothetical protein
LQPGKNQGTVRDLRNVAQRLETGLEQIVDLDVAGSNPVTRPNIFNILRM